MTAHTSDPRQCERCGDTIGHGCEWPLGDYLFLCAACERKLTPTADAVFVGVQQGFADLPPLCLFNLNQDIPGHRAGSTVSRRSVEAAGYQLPAAEVAKAQAALLNHMAQRRCIHKEAA